MEQTMYKCSIPFHFSVLFLHEKDASEKVVIYFRVPQYQGQDSINCEID